MARDRPKGRWRQRKPETGDRDTSRKHFIHKNQACSLRPLPRKGKGQRLRGVGAGGIDPSSSPSPPQHPSEPSYPAPQLKGLSPPPSNRDQRPTPHYRRAQGPWRPRLRDPSNEV